jgi:hypothetical protein
LVTVCIINSGLRLCVLVCTVGIVIPSLFALRFLVEQGPRLLIIPDDVADQVQVAAQALQRRRPHELLKAVELHHGPELGDVTAAPIAQRQGKRQPTS